MATLNLSTNGPSITKSYQSVVNSSLPSNGAGGSSTYGQWAIYTVQAPLLSAFQQDSNKDSVLKVQSTGEGELVDLVEEFSDGRIQFAFVKVKDSNSGLPKSVLIGWCGEGVPERTKGYFTSHLAAVAKLLHGYHVQIVARTENDLTPESIVRKVADASGAKYSGGDSSKSSSNAPAPPVASKPAFQPTRQAGGSTGFNPLGSRTRAAAPKDDTEDGDGWGADAPDVTRRQLTKVEPAYKRTVVNMSELTSQKQEPSRFTPAQSESSNASSDVVRGGYQPIGKIDIAALRRQAQESGSAQDDRPTTVKGAYEPIGKVDIAAIRAKAQPASSSPAPASSRSNPSNQDTQDDDDAPKSLADRSAAFTQSERISSMPKPKVANKFGSSASSFAGTKAPAPIGFSSRPLVAAAPVGAANKNFAEQGGKTPAQIWAEKKAKQGGGAPSGPARTPSFSQPIASQPSGGEWKSGYSGKSWGAVQTTRTGQSQSGAQDDEEAEREEEQETAAPSGGVNALKDRFKQPMGAPMPSRGRDADEEEEEEDSGAAHPPPMDFSNKPNASTARGVPMPGLPKRQPEPEEDEEIPEEEPSRMPTPPAQPPRTPTPDEEERSSSPIRIAMPVGRTQQKAMVPVSMPPPTMPTASLAKVIPQEEDLEDEPQAAEYDPARNASQMAAASTFGSAAVATANPGAKISGKRAIVQFDYEKAEDNELELKDGETITNIEMVDDDWWMGENSRGEAGLFPSNYVELVEEPTSHAPSAAVTAVHAPPAPPAPAAGPAGGGAKKGPTATAQYDYEAVEDNELSFPDGATITDLEFPDDDWWMGSFGGKSGLFPANYVQLDE